MKKSSLILILCPVLLLLGCNIFDRNDNCPSTQLCFEYKADGLKNVLPQYIHEAVVFIYNSKGVLIYKTTLKPKDFLNPNGVRLPNLVSGNYKVVAWGNETHSSFSEEKSLSEATLVSENPPTKNEALYYASTSIEINEKEIQKFTVSFASAHIKFQVICSNYSTIYGEEDSPFLEIINAGYTYSFISKTTIPLPQQLTSFIIPLKKEKNNWHMVRFNLFRFGTKNELKIKLGQLKTCDIIKEINLQKLIKDKLHSLELQQEVYLKIEVDFTPQGIIIKPPLWENHPLIPDLT